MTCISELITRAARVHAGRTAVVDGQRRLTFLEIEQRANRLANALHGLSEAPGGRVAVLMSNRSEQIEIDFALSKAAKVKVPINPRLADEEREYILEDTGAEMLLFDPGHAAFAERVRERLPGLRDLISLDERGPGSHEYESLLERGDDRSPGIHREPSEPSLIMYTSGTSGRPKGAVATDGSRLAATRTMLTDELELGPDSTMAHAASLAHGSGSKVLAYFLRGGCNLALRKFDPEHFLSLIETGQVTGTFLVPAMVSMLVEAAGDRPVQARPDCQLTYGGAPMPISLLEQALRCFGPVFVQIYGSCEALHPSLVLGRHDHGLEPDQRARLGSAGQAVMATEVRVVGEDGTPAPDGERGELRVRGPNVMAGYWNAPEATEAAVHDGWYRTGDVAWRDEHGFHYIVDRLRDMIISGGYNVYPAEVESVIGLHPSVAEVAVAGVPSSRWGEAVKAFVVLKPDAAASEEDLIAHCRAHLAAYKKPQYIEFRGGLPKGATGKILKRALVEPDWKDYERRVN
jgi:acyl-CoA synthetase (AMP-forming)/AMP-acid ligase II